ncbi:MAG: methyltransferase domain-containing protein [Candidatus Acidiferrales bacterium]
MFSLSGESRHAAIILGLVVILFSLDFLLLRFYRVRKQGFPAGKLSKFFHSWDFSPEDLGGFSYSKLALVSGLSLFLELLMIRWVSSEIHVFAYFKNFVLVACFLGFGVGCYLCRRRANFLALAMPLLTVAVVIKWPSTGLRFLVARLPDYIGAYSNVDLWGMPRLALGWYSFSALAAATALIVSLFAMIAFIFIPFGQFVGWYLENTKRGILGYTVNILASLTGIGFYTLLCFMDKPPVWWFAAGGLVLVILLWKRPRVSIAAAGVFAVCAIFASLGPGAGSTTYWSPYQKLTLTPEADPKSGELLYYQLNTNDSWYQLIMNLSPEFVAGHPALFGKEGADWNAYNLPYHFYEHPPDVLVLGSGMGNDVAAALRHGAERVTAVEIDPLILDLGRKLHFEKPYSSPKVKVVVDDARSYIQTSQERFDLIMFSLLDSHTTSSSYSNIRIDNYVYTVEALRAARQMLKPDGLFIVKFVVQTPFIAGRLQALLSEVFGTAPLQIQIDVGGARFFIAGSEARVRQALLDPGLGAYYEAHRHFEMAPAPLTSDDWPYFYQKAPGVPASVVIVSTALLIMGWFFLSGAGISRSSFSAHFFFLGAAFMLLEAQIVSKMALLFGTTWMVNSIVISGLLLLIVGSNMLVEWQPKIPVEIAYAGIFLSMLAAYLIPMERFIFTSIWLKALTASLVLCLPVFFAGIVFIRSFARAGFSGNALGSNLLGALAGGLLESLSFWTGIRSLLIVAALLYLASWLAISSLSSPQVAPTRAGHD